MFVPTEEDNRMVRNWDRSSDHGGLTWRTNTANAHAQSTTTWRRGLPNTVTCQDLPPRPPTVALTIRPTRSMGSQMRNSLCDSPPRSCSPKDGSTRCRSHVSPGLAPGALTIASPGGRRMLPGWLSSSARTAAATCRWPSTITASIRVARMRAASTFRPVRAARAGRARPRDRCRCRWRASRWQLRAVPTDMTSVPRRSCIWTWSRLFPGCRVRLRRATTSRRLPSSFRSTSGPPATPDPRWPSVIGDCSRRSRRPSPAIVPVSTTCWACASGWCPRRPGIRGPNSRASCC